MAFIKVAALTISAGAYALAGGIGPVPQHLAVYVTRQGDVSPMISNGAAKLTVKIFAKIGVDLEWHWGDPLPNALIEEQPILVTLLNDEGTGARPGVFAYATPYEGAHTTVLYQRIARAHPEPYETQVVLAYVLVHEITHLLQGIARHSDTGIMKTQWGRADVWAMRNGKLTFEPIDVGLIRDGLAARASLASRRETLTAAAGGGF